MTIKLTKKLYRVTVYQVRKETVEILIKLKYMVFYLFKNITFMTQSVTTLEYLYTS